MGKMIDVLNVMQGKPLEAKPVKRKVVKKVTKETKAEKPKSKVTEEAKSSAYDYAGNKDALSDDIRAALRGESLTDDLKKMLQVLVDNYEFRVIIADRDGVLPSKDDYYLDYEFVDKDSNICTVMADALLSAGQDVDNLERYNMKLKVVKKRKLDDSVIDGDAGKPSDDEVALVAQQIRAKYAAAAG